MAEDGKNEKKALLVSILVACSCLFGYYLLQYVSEKRSYPNRFRNVQEGQSLATVVEIMGRKYDEERTYSETGEDGKKHQMTEYLWKVTWATGTRYNRERKLSLYYVYVENQQVLRKKTVTKDI